MSNSSDCTSKKKGYDDDAYAEYHNSTWESAVLIPREQTTAPTNTISKRHDYPGNRRIPMSSSDIPYGNILIRTAGNALQAIPATVLEEKQQRTQLIEVRVPPNTQPGDTIHIRSPYTCNNEEELIAATIPDGAHPDQIFYVQCPSNATNTTHVELTTVAIATEEKVDNYNRRGWCWY